MGKSSGNPNLAVVSKNMSVPTVTIVTKPQVPSVVPRPSFRISTGPSLQQMTPGPSISTAIRPSSTMAQTIQISQSTTSLIANNPLKRKLDDDDYDT